METWAQTTFGTGLAGLIIYTDDAGNSTMVDSSVFGGSDFSAITTNPPAYADLSTLHIASQGWQKVFAQWKEKGIVS